MRTIEVPEEVAEALEAQALRSGLSLAEVLRLLTATSEGDDAAIRTHPDFMGGDDCVRSTRIPVWLLVSARQQGQSDVQILEGVTHFALCRRRARACLESLIRATSRTTSGRSSRPT